MGGLWSGLGGGQGGGVVGRGVLSGAEGVATPVWSLCDVSGGLGVATPVYSHERVLYLVRNIC